MSRRLRGWWRSAGGSERPMFSPKGVDYSHKTSWGDSEAFMVRELSTIWQQNCAPHVHFSRKTGELYRTTDKGLIYQPNFDLQG